MNYAVNEVFVTIQGEGFYTGTPAVFIRLQGCDVGCPWCDTRHTWVLDYDWNAMTLDSANAHPKRWTMLSANELVRQVGFIGKAARHVVITGGEPFQQPLRELVTALRMKDYRVQIETSGCFPVLDLIPSQAWITVSPKLNMPGGYQPLAETMQLAQEIKMPIKEVADFDRLDQLIKDYHLQCPVYLQPLSQSQRITKLCVQMCMERNWNLSLQTHKFIGLP